MTRIERIIVAVLGLSSASLLGYIVGSQTSHDTAGNSSANRQPKCDSAEAVATIKNMALEKINDKYKGDELISLYSRKYLGKNPVEGKLVPYISPKMGDLFSIEEVTMDSFRSQGNIGTGLRCAAVIGVVALGKKAPSEISVEYTIEPTTDGKTIVSARFRPHS